MLFCLIRVVTQIRIYHCFSVPPSTYTLSCLAHGSWLGVCLGGLFVPSRTILPSPALPRGWPNPPVPDLCGVYTGANWRWLEVRRQAFPLVILLFHLCISGGLRLFRGNVYMFVFQPNTILFSDYDFFSFAVEIHQDAFLCLGRCHAEIWLFP